MEILGLRIIKSGVMEWGVMMDCNPVELFPENCGLATVNRFQLRDDRCLIRFSMLGWVVKSPIIF